MSGLKLGTQLRGACSSVPVTTGAQLLPNLGGGGLQSLSHVLVFLFSPSARELELEDRQSRLQQELRERMAVEGEGAGLKGAWDSWVQAWPRRPNVFGHCADHLKTEEELSEEKKILNEMLEVVEQRDALVALLEEQRLREKEEDKDLEAVMLSKGFSLNWS